MKYVYRIATKSHSQFRQTVWGKGVPSSSLHKDVLLGPATCESAVPASGPAREDRSRGISSRGGKAAAGATGKMLALGLYVEEFGLSVWGRNNIGRLKVHTRKAEPRSSYGQGRTVNTHAQLQPMSSCQTSAEQHAFDFAWLSRFGIMLGCPASTTSYS